MAGSSWRGAWAIPLVAAALLLLACRPAEARKSTRSLLQAGYAGNETVGTAPYIGERGGTVPAGYTMYRGWWMGGHPGVTLRAMPYNTIAQMATNCTADPYCVAFDTGFYERYAIKPYYAWSNATGSTFIKNNVVPGALAPMVIPGYKFVSMKQSPGFSNITGGNMNNPPNINAQLCNANPDCKGFTAYSAQLKGLIKKEECWAAITPYWNQNDGMYIKETTVLQNPTPPAPIPGFQWQQNLDSTGNNISRNTTATVAELGAMCAADPDCKGFNTQGWLKNLIKPKSEWTGMWDTLCNGDQGMFVKVVAPSPAPSPDTSPAVSPEPSPATSPDPSPAVLPPASPSPPPSSSEKMGVWIPFYAYPSNVFDSLIKSVENNACLAGSFKACVLIGPGGGPPPLDDTGKVYRDYFGKIAGMQEWTTMGYLHTGYQSRPLDEVLKQIDLWLTPGAAGYGDMVQGIWVNQVSPSFNATSLDYINAVIDRIKFYGKLVALNPGLDMQDCKVAARADFINAFENTQEVWDSKDWTCTCKGSTRCIASIHGYTGAGDAADLAAVMSKARARGFKATFITEREIPDQYSALPSFWPAELQALCKTNV